MRNGPIRADMRPGDECNRSVTACVPALRVWRPQPTWWRLPGNAAVRPWRWPIQMARRITTC